MTMLKKVNKSKLGFTLIELLVVIAIIGILASIVLASLNTARVKARDARRIADVKQIQLALELYADSSAGAGKYPVGSSTCAYPTTNHGLEAINPNQISQVPRDPTASASDEGCYNYASGSASTAKTSYYHIGAVLEDSNNSALAGDRDCDDSTTDAALGCGFNAVVAATEGSFSGRDDNTNRVFDLTN